MAVYRAEHHPTIDAGGISPPYFGLKPRGDIPTVHFGNFIPETPNASDGG
jgi:hypothetical protein